MTTLTSELVPEPRPAGQRAVFLSYASEDASAAQRICAALRAGGIEAWFDQSELRGGDLWDSTIRKQIKSCALFIPIISMNTHARTEGYFRLEWKLAIDRSHLLAPDQAFLVPVAIDQTPQSDERVPDRFHELQWTRLAGGTTPSEFVERIARLLAQATGQARLMQRSNVLAVEAVAAGVTPGSSPTAAAPGRPSRQRKTVALLAAVVAVAAGCFLLYRLIEPKQAREDAIVSTVAATPAPAAEKSIAVLPFADESQNRDQGYFSDGLSDEMIDMLAKIPGLRVPARTSSFYFKDRQATLADIGKMLNVTNVLEGSVRKSGSAMRISAELIRISDDTRVWSETYDRKLDDVFKVQDEIAGAVVAALKISMLGEPKARAAPTRSSAAYVHYLRAVEAFRGSGNDETPDARADLEKAIELDPSFAQAWQALGSWELNAFVGSGAGSYDQVHHDALTAFQRALSLDPDLADAHAELARLYYMLDWNAAAALPELERALAIDPKNVSALWLTGYIADSEGRFDEAVAMHNRVRDLDPLFADNYRQLGNAYYRSGRLIEGADILAEAVKRFPTAHTVHYRRALVLLALKQPDAALVEFSAEQQQDFHLLGMPLALDRLGRRQEADRALAQALAIETVRNGAAYQIALVYAARGDADLAFEWLTRAFAQRDAGMHWMKYDPLLQPFKKDPRFKSLLAQMHQS
jgi:TolB-like protein/tetratricopeptide (TPR) repeat protein